MEENELKRYWLILALLIATATLVQAEHYVMIPLGWLALAPETSYGTAINDRWQMTGYSATAEGAYHAYYWSAYTGMVDIGALPGTKNSYGKSLNNFGQVVGSSDQNAFLWSKNTMIDLGPGTANSINAGGLIAGSSNDRPCLWDKGNEIHFLSDKIGEADSITNSGGVGGRVINNAALWWKHQSFALKLPDANFSIVRAVNERGDSAGLLVRWLSDSDESYAFFAKRSGKVTIIGEGEAFDMNNSGHIVGQTNGKGFVWSERDGVVVLNDVTVNRDKWDIISANGINNYGSIAATASEGKSTQAVLLIPCLEGLF